MSKKFKIEKATWNEKGHLIKAVNSEFFDLLSPIAAYFSNCGKDYLYCLNYKFGDCLIRNGKMSVLPKNDLASGKCDTFYFDQDGDNTLLAKEFLDNVGNTQGHPLSIVISNYIEVYREQLSGYQLEGSSPYLKSYRFPLNLIREGDLFGVFESINMMFDSYKRDIGGWHAVAGKCCLLSTLPEKFNQDFKRYSFKEIFGENAADVYEGFNHVAQELCPSGHFTETILFPEYYFLKSKDDSKELIELKNDLREFILKIGWEQETLIIDVGMDEAKLLRHFTTTDLTFAIPLARHIVNIAESKAYLLKPIDQNDGFLYEVYDKILDKFNKTKMKNGIQAIEYNTPLFFHYDKLSDTNKWGFEMTHSPSSKIVLPPKRLEQVRKVINNTLMFGNKLKLLIEEKNHDVDLEFYVVADKSNKNPLLIKEFIDTTLLNDLRVSHPEIKKIKTTDLPWYFNALLVIKKID